MLEFVEYDESFLALSWLWLKDPEISILTMTPEFTKDEQLIFFKSLGERRDYFIRGITYQNKKIGAVGIKNINHEKGEYWGYIGEKNYWGQGLGREIMQKIISEARLLGLKKLYLQVNSNNQRAINLYKREGFVLSSVDEQLIKMERWL
ncbi:GNAT family N-acetyltransferase [Enterobacter roggenkampii]|uniref:GNAT family N-acetyltransferase n=1 Tax=Enterobacter roggenkampii TaxID=1812935 RepID=UPI0020052FE0|nr:GNAT family N-acetyltransferase [Enterobacter roggenkampii]MCK6670342.1 GNAT family N-acetyltransferase [Enterobacter roggenkampii]MCK7011758.1 GNAT family N-acetyltransferase [Enterobacter roggenkampii]MCK7026664.1 GNAT family N-acetyltransferase [Enterobacter roggenkampii]MCO4144699.1 GNAT family N-acetyltransferase [Enterobacter roggenkampii]MCU6163445.1 GNAT family N-acetyltransferase [Enterobacter roggenkampii]